MRTALILVVLVACTHPTKPSIVKPAGNGSGTTVADNTRPKPRPPKPGEQVAPDIGCPTSSCVFHAGAGMYFTCLAGGSGVCFHFGAACNPPDACMFDPADRTYKTCTSPVEGTCTAFAKPCAPATKCMFDPASGLHRSCDHPDNGKCASYGAICAP